MWASWYTRDGAHHAAAQPPQRLTVTDWWEWLASRLHPQYRTFVLLTDGGAALSALGLWPRVDAGEWSVRQSSGDYSSPATNNPGQRVGKPHPVILGPAICLVGASHGGWECLFVGLANYTKMHARDLVSQHCSPELARLEWESPGEVGDESPRLQCVAATRWLRGAVDSVVAGNVGGWAPTPGLIGMSAWRRSGGAKGVRGHDCPRTLQLERLASHGGAKRVWWHGDVGSRAEDPTPEGGKPPPASWHLEREVAARYDVRSMYPTLLAHNLFPVRLTQYLPRPKPAALAKALRTQGAVAVVRLQSDVAEYPRRRGECLAYPTGEYWTALAGPELEAALGEGAVTDCAGAALYELASPFTGVVTRLLNWRASAKSIGNSAGEALAKQVANALGGKFAQRSPKWEVMPGEHARRPWHTWLQTCPDGGPTERRKSVAGVVSRLLDCDPLPRLPVAVYCYLTAYGRMAMRRYRAALPTGGVFSQDTDGLWVRGGLALDVAPVVGQSAVPTLVIQHEETSLYSVWYSAHHYYASGRWVLAGAPLSTRRVEGRYLVYTSPTDPATGRPYTTPTGADSATVRIPLSRLGASDQPGEDGWTVPPALTATRFAGRSSAPEWPGLATFLAGAG